MPILSTVAALWTMSDAWVFSFVEGTGPADGYTLAQIIAKADAINHDILPELDLARRWSCVSGRCGRWLSAVMCTGRNGR